MRSEAIAFDYDGTLIDTISVKIESYAQATEAVFATGAAQRPVIKATQLRFGGAPKFVQLAETLRALCLRATEAQKEEWGRRYVAYNETHTPLCPEFAVVRTMLAALVARYDLYLFSGVPQAQLEADVQRRGLAGYFRDIRGGDKTAFCREWKRCGYRRMLFVGDGTYDEAAARAAQIPFVHVARNEDLTRLMKRLLAAGRARGV